MGFFNTNNIGNTVLLLGRSLDTYLPLMNSVDLTLCLYNSFFIGATYFRDFDHSTFAIATSCAVMLISFSMVFSGFFLSRNIANVEKSNNKVWSLGRIWIVSRSFFYMMMILNYA